MKRINLTLYALAYALIIGLGIATYQKILSARLDAKIDRLNRELPDTVIFTHYYIDGKLWKTVKSIKP